MVIGTVDVTSPHVWPRVVREPSRVLRWIRRRWRDAGRGALVCAASRHIPCAAATALVEPGIALPLPLDVCEYRIGKDPFQPRVSFLADLREPDSLGAERFDLVVLDRAFDHVDPDTAVANVLRALNPGGVLVAPGVKSLGRAVSRTFDACEFIQVRQRRVLVARKAVS